MNSLTAPTRASGFCEKSMKTYKNWGRTFSHLVLPYLLHKGIINVCDKPGCFHKLRFRWHNKFRAVDRGDSSRLFLRAAKSGENINENQKIPGLPPGPGKLKKIRAVGTCGQKNPRTGTCLLYHYHKALGFLFPLLRLHHFLFLHWRFTVRVIY